MKLLHFTQSAPIVWFKSKALIGMSHAHTLPTAIDHDFLVLAFEASGDCVKMLALDGTILAINTGGLCLMDFDPGQTPLGSNWIDFWTGADRTAVIHAVEAAGRGEKGTLRNFLPTAKGEPKWWDITVIPVPGQDGLAEHVLVISRDVTAHHEAAQALDRSTRLFQGLIEASAEMVWHFDVASGRTERRGYVEFTGEADDPYDIDGWIAHVHPDDVARSQEAADLAASTSQPLLVQYRLRHTSGVWRWVEDRAMPVLDEGGRVSDWVGIVTDIHDRKCAEEALRNSEERLRLALDSAELGTWDVDFATGERQWSREAKLMFGIPPESQILNETLLDLVHPEDRSIIEQDRRLSRAQRSGTSTLRFRILHHETGETRWIVSRGRAVCGEDGRSLRRVGTFLDDTERKRTQDALRSASRRYEAIVRAGSEIVWYADAAQQNSEGRGWAVFTGRSPSEADGGGWLRFVHPDDREAVESKFLQALATEQDYVNEYRLRHASGEWRWVVDQSVALRSEDGRLEAWAGTITDIHDRKMAQQALQKSEEHRRLALDATALGTWDVNLVTGATEWSPEFCHLLGLPPSVVPDRTLFVAGVHPEDRATADALIQGFDIPSERPTVGMFRLLSSDGTERWVEAQGRTFFSPDGKPVRRVGTLRDVTDRKRAEQQIWMAAHTDALTGIANRALFQTRLDQAVADAAVDGTCVGLLIIDVDRFKDVNDSLGHGAGDALLRGMAQRLRDNVPPLATVARLGGDEFGVIVPVQRAAELEALPSSLLTLLKAPMTYSDRDLDCSASIGWSVFPDHDPAASALLRHADIALYAVKAAGRGHARAFAPAMLAETQRRVNVLRCAKEALIRDAILPVYQPKVSLQSGAVMGFEALLRWTDDSGLRSPGALQEAFDDRELSVKLGARMLEKIVADMREWTDAGMPFGHVGLNVATPEFHGPCLGTRLLEALDAARLKPHHLEIEVTERVLLDQGLEAIGKVLNVLAGAGVPIALDDFGTGYASLTHLKRFPVTWLKIDRSFILNMEQDPDSVAIVRAVTQMAHSIGIKVVAEGIETAAQLDQLVGIGCDLGQGYLLAKPMVASRVPFFLSHWTGLPRQDEPRAKAARRR